MKKVLFIIALSFVLLAGCAGVPVREPVKLDLNAPVGKIEGNQFVGVRYPFKVSAPPGWKVTMKYPDFMLAQGYHKEGLEESQVFVFNPVTESNVQIELTPAGRYAKFDQQEIERMVSGISGEFASEVKEHHGTSTVLSPTVPVSLKGVQYAAGKYGTFTVTDIKREQGWIYGFTEPYQIFILYIVQEKAGTGTIGKEREDLKKILDSFEVFLKK
jgi:hypothetical protein